MEGKYIYNLGKQELKPIHSSSSIYSLRFSSSGKKLFVNYRGLGNKSVQSEITMIDHKQGLVVMFDVEGRTYAFLVPNIHEQVITVKLVC